MIKRFTVLLAIMLLLTGCANEYPEATETSTAIETTPAGYYEDGSQVELQTNGAVRRFSLPDADYCWMRCIDSRMLLATGSDKTSVQLLTGETCVPAATENFDYALDNYVALFNGFAYYDSKSNSVVYLDPQLKQTMNVTLPDEVRCPVISRDGNQIYYCVGNEIRAMDAVRKLSRLVKTLSTDTQTLIDTCFEGKILICSVANNLGGTDTLYISTENGQTLYSGEDVQSLSTCNDIYYAERTDGIILQRIVGTLAGDAKQLNITDPNLVAALEIGGIVGYTIDKDGILLNLYDFNSGKKCSSATISGVEDLQICVADRWSKSFWMLCSGAIGDNVLLRWDVSKSLVQDENIYIGQLYTAEQPDEASLEALNERIGSLDKKFGVRIRIWNEAVKSPGGHTLVPEHQIPAITRMLDDIEMVLGEFPKKFVSKSISSKLRICLVRSVDGEMRGLQYWDGKYAFIALAAGVDVRSEFLKCFGSVIDSHVLGNSPQYDYWESLNPTGFIYGMSNDESLTAGDQRAFVDVESMYSGTADRARVFWQAMQRENSEMFTSDTMQGKLLMLCKAIRDAWNLEKNTDIFPWEQYLKTPIAYKKK